MTTSTLEGREIVQPAEAGDRRLPVPQRAYRRLSGVEADRAPAKAWWKSIPPGMSLSGAFFDGTIR